MDDLLGFASFHELARAVGKVLGLPEDRVRECLFREAVQRGWNVVKEARDFGVTPHIYDERMAAFYEQTHAFVYELVVSHLRPYAMEVDRRVVEAITKRHRSPDDVHALMLGDGIGYNSLRVSALGYAVTYFDLEGPTSRFALHLFGCHGLQDRITVLHKLDAIPHGRFDVVVCQEVLEHVDNPPGVVSDIWTYLKPGGTAVITESFARVSPEFPTHLAASMKYAGNTDRLFVQAGFRLIECYPQQRPMIFEKTDKTDRSRFDSLKRPVRERLVGLARKMAKRLLGVPGA